MKNVNRGKYIALEGIDGSGKDTHMPTITKVLRENNVKFITTKEPGGSHFGESIRHTLLSNRRDDIDPVTELLLLSADRKENIEKVVKPALEQGIWVVSNRSFGSSYAYQCLGHEVDLQLFNVVTAHVVGKVVPDLTLLFDLEVEEAMKRVSSRGERDRMDALDVCFYNRVSRGYRTLAESSTWQVVDAMKPIESVAMEVTSKINSYLSKGNL